MFVALANARHFGRAAEAVGVTQPTLSSAIKQLEEQLGVQLVHRGSRFQGLTPEGERVYDQVLGIIGAARALREEMRAVRSGLSGDLRIGVIPTALAMVSDLVVPLTERHPGVRVHILSRSAHEILDQIESLELDAGLSYVGAEPERRASRVPLFRESYRLLVAASHPLARRDSVSWSEVGALPLCLLTRDMQNRRIVDARLDRAGASVTPMVTSNSFIVLLSHVMTGKWATVAPARLAAAFGTGGLAAVPILDAEEEQEIGLILFPRELRTGMLAALEVVAKSLATSLNA